MRRFASLLIAVVFALSISVLPVRAMPPVDKLTAIAGAPDVFTEDGAMDLALGYSDRSAGAVAVLPGNPMAQLGLHGPAFERALPRTSIPVAAELIATGDFDNDGHRDVVATAVGASGFYLLRGDGAGRLANPQEFGVDGHVTAIASGEVNRTDGLAELVVGVDGANGSMCLEYEGPDGALNASPEVIALPSPALSIAIGHVVGPVLGDIAMACGTDTVVIEGRDRCLLAGEEGTRGVGSPKLHAIHSSHGAARVVVRDVDGDHEADLLIDDLDGRRLAVAHTDDSGSLGLPAVFAPIAPIAGMPDMDDDPRAIRVRLNGDAVDDFVIADGRGAVPAVVLSEPLSTFTVTTDADSGPGSLRQAILDANANPGVDRIAFSTGYNTSLTIRPLTSLPPLTDPVSVDGYTSATPGGRGASPQITLEGSDDARTGLEFTTGDSVVRGISFDKFIQDEDGVGGAGILLRSGSGSRIEACLFGAYGPEHPVTNIWGIQILDSSNNTIGGALPGAANVFVGNATYGISCYGPDNLILGNYFGCDSTFTSVNPNSNGAQIDNAPRNRIGGTLPGEGNYAFAAYSYGLDVVSNDAAENLVQGNFVGIDPSLSISGLATYGIGVCGGANNGAKANFIGGTAAGAGNMISNSDIGVAIGTGSDSTATENRVLCNTIFSNRLIGIDLSDDTYSYNDPMDADGGPNLQQNAPELTGSRNYGDQILISGRISTTPNSSFRLEFYSGSGFSQIGFGGGGALAGTADVATDASGLGEFEASIPMGAVTGPSISATATSAAGNSSEFSLSIALSVSWDSPDPDAGPNAPPRNLRIGLPETGGRGAGLRTSPGAPTGYNVYRGKVPTFTVGPESLFQGNVPQTAIGSFAFPSGSFFKITAIYPGGESAPTDATGGGVPPSITGTRIKKGKLLVDGDAFSNPPLVLLDGIPFNKAAKLKTANRVVQKSPTILGDAIVDFIRRNNGSCTVMVRNSTGGSALRRVTL